MIENTEFRSLGYGREAMQEVLNHLFNSLKIQEIFFGVDMKNLGAISLYKSLDFSACAIEENRMIMVERVSTKSE